VDADFPQKRGTLTNIPAGPNFLLFPFFHRVQKKQLALHMHGNLAPTLLKALHGSQRSPQEFRHLLLGLLKLLT